MKNEKLIHAIGKIDDDLIFNAVNDVKAGKKERWFKWGAVAACLCLIAAAVYTVNTFVFAPENDQYMDACTEDDSLDGSPNGYDIIRKEQTPDDVDITEQDNEAQIQGSHARKMLTGIPDNVAFDPSNMTTMISSYGNTGSAVSYKSPDNGSCLYSIPLQGAMEEYGDTVLYRVVVDVFSDNQMIEIGSEAAKNEMDRLAELEYTVAFEKYYDGTMNHYYFTLHATQEQQADFDINNEYGYMMNGYNRFRTNHSKRVFSWNR